MLAYGSELGIVLGVTSERVGGYAGFNGGWARTRAGLGITYIRLSGGVEVHINRVHVGGGPFLRQTRFERVTNGDTLDSTDVGAFGLCRVDITRDGHLFLQGELMADTLTSVGGSLAVGLAL